MKKKQCSRLQNAAAKLKVWSPLSPNGVDLVDDDECGFRIGGDAVLEWAMAHPWMTFFIILVSICAIEEIIIAICGLFR